MRLILFLVAVVSTAACTTVRPYERGLLQSPLMTFPSDPTQSANDGHILGTRESMTGGTGAGGSSCGCT